MIPARPPHVARSVPSRPLRNLHRPALALAVAALAAATPSLRAADLAFVGTAATSSSLSLEEKEAFNWAVANYSTTYVPFSTINTNASALNQYKAVWWHYDETTTMPAAATATNVKSRINSFVSNGKGLFLSGFASRYVVDLGLESTTPTTILKDPKVTGAWGFQKKVIPHPIFKALANTFPTVSAGLNADNNICWWDNSANFHGRWLTDTEWAGSKVTTGEFRPGRGRVIVVGAGAYEWHFASGTNTNRPNLQNYTKNIINYVGAFADANTVAWWRFDEASGKSAWDDARKVTDTVSQQLIGEWTQGVHGNALRFDGHSTWVNGTLAAAKQPTSEMTIECWVAPKAYPNGDAAIVNQHAYPNGYFLGIDKYGKWNFSLGQAGTWRTAFAPSPMPKFQWNHVVATFKSGDGIRLYLNGAQVAYTALGAGNLSNAAATPLLVGKHNNATLFGGLFQKQVFNGLMDDVKVMNRALTAQEIADNFSYAQPPAVPKLAVSASRFSSDLQRPRFHPMPPADWCNESYGALFFNNLWHVFYQYNPNGSYLDHMHWGHMVSTNLRDWTNLPTPLWPEAGKPDANGSWSGDVIPFGGGVATAYTSNDAAQTQSVGFGSDSMLMTWSKHPGNPVTGAFPPDIPPADVAGFRDPCLFNFGGYTYMAIGSGHNTNGGFLPLYRSTNMTSWEYRGRLFESGSANGTMWEMPNFFEITPGTWVLILNRLPNPAPIYWIGTFANERFTPNNPTPQRFDIGAQYLSPTFAKAPDGRWLAFGIIPEDRFSADQNAAGWANVLSLPREVTLQAGFLGQWPAAEVDGLRGTLLKSQANFLVNPGTTGYLNGVSGNQLDIRVRVDMQTAETFGVILRKSAGGQELTRVAYNTNKDLFVVRDTSSLANSVGKWTVAGQHPLGVGELLDLRIILDRSVLSVHANGRQCLTTRIYPTRTDSLGLDLYTLQNAARVVDVNIWSMNNMVLDEYWNY